LNKNNHQINNDLNLLKVTKSNDTKSSTKSSDRRLVFDKSQYETNKKENDNEEDEKDVEKENSDEKYNLTSNPLLNDIMNLDQKYDMTSVKRSNKD